MLCFISCFDVLNVYNPKETVNLSKEDLEAFELLKQELLNDLARIRKVMPDSDEEWVFTNSYYLNQVDSIKYTPLLKRLKGKYVDNFAVDESGNCGFILKEYVDRNASDYNHRYEQQLISIKCNCLDNFTTLNGDTIFVDSIVNNNWRYISRMYYTGH